MTPSVQALARRNLTALLQAIAEVKQVRVAELTDISETMLSRMHAPQGKDERSDLEKLCAIAAACNLVLVPRTMTVVDPDHLRALRVLARASIDMQDVRDAGMGAL